MSTTYIADVDLVGSETQRPFMRLFVSADDEATALARARDLIEDGEAVRDRVVALQSILDEVKAGIADGRRYGIDFKYESGPEGPVWITDLDAMDEASAGARVVATPFGVEPSWSTALPWMRRSAAKRLANYLGLPLGES